MTSQRRRVVLQDNIILKNFEAMAYDADWFFEDKVPRTDHTPLESIWVLEDDSGSVHYIEDFLLGTKYVLVDSPDPEPIINIIRRVLPVIDREAILKSVKSAHSTEERVQSLHRVAAVSTSVFDQELFSVITHALQYPDPNVRRAAILAAGYAEWHQLEEPLRQVIGQDSDSQVKQEARQMLEGLLQVWS